MMIGLVVALSAGASAVCSQMEFQGIGEVIRQLVS